jgi:hypothetical protein
LGFIKHLLVNPFREVITTVKVNCSGSISLNNCNKSKLTVPIIFDNKISIYQVYLLDPN